MFERRTICFVYGLVDEYTWSLAYFTECYSVIFAETPIVVSILDGGTLRLFLEDEDDFAMLAENLFTDLDEEDKGKLCKSEIRKALSHMGVDMGVPPLSGFFFLCSFTLPSTVSIWTESLELAYFHTLVSH